MNAPLESDMAVWVEGLAEIKTSLIPSLLIESLTFPLISAVVGSGF
jgi:hypothetical protein